MDKAKQATAESLDKTRQNVAGQTTMDKAKNLMHEGQAKMGLGGEQSITDCAKEGLQQTRDKFSGMMEQGREKASNIVEESKKKLGMGGEQQRRA